MYKYLWSNGPKECFEYPDYTFEQHFKKPIPSFPPRAVMRDYLEGRWNSSKLDLKQFVKLHHVVRDVQYRQQSDDFLVTVENLAINERFQEIFSHVIVATGIFNVPDVPSIPGIDTFNGRIIHSHDFRNAREIQGQRLLAIGGSYSAEDVAMQCVKYGAQSAIISWRTKPLGFQWPDKISERPLVQLVNGNEVYFKDGYKAEVDSIIFCTGYKYNFPYMDTNLRLVSKRTYYPDNLYKGTLWLEGGNKKLFYIGVQDQFYTFTMFDAEALWISKYIMGQIPGEPKSMAEMRKDVAKWRKGETKLKGDLDEIRFQTEFMADLCTECGYDRRVIGTKRLFEIWEQTKMDVQTYREKSYTSLYTNKPSPIHEPWATAFDDSLEGFLNK